MKRCYHCLHWRPLAEVFADTGGVWFCDRPYVAACKERRATLPDWLR